jgi:hypothetical protein
MRSIIKFLVCTIALSAWGLSGAQSVYNQIPFSTNSKGVLIAPATPAATSVKGSAGTLLSVVCFNLLATPVYVKLYDATSVTLGTTSAALDFMCPGNTAGTGFVVATPYTFATGIQMAVTGGISLTDNTSITASSVVVNYTFQ